MVWGAYDVVALDGSNGSLKWRATSGQRVWPGVAVADLTGDGTLEVIVGRSGDQVTVYNRFGSVVWTRNPFGSGEVRTLAVADLETDGALEIVAGRASGGSTRQLDVFEPDGSVRPGWPARRDGEPGYGWGMYNENVAVADMNGDGFKEIFGPTDTHYITALDRGGNQLPASAIYGAGKVWSQVGVHVDHAVDLRGYANCGVEHRPNFADSAPIVADVNADGVPEMIVVGNVYNCGTDPYTSLYQMPFILKLDRTRWSGSGFDWTAIPVPGPGRGPRSEDYNVIETAVPNPVAADLDGDGRLEILFPSYDGKLHAYWLDKTEHGSWPYTVPATGRRRHLPLRQRAGGGRPRRRRPGGGDLRLVAEEGDRSHGPPARAELARGRAPPREPARAGNRRRLERRPRRAHPRQHRRRRGPRGGARDLGERRRGLRPAGLRGRACPVGHRARRVPPDRHDGDPLDDDRRPAGDRGERRDDERGLHGSPLGHERAGGDGGLRHGNGSAMAPADYATTSGTLSFPIGTTTRTITVPVVGDLLDEANETFLVRLSNPAGALIGDGQATGTIADDDPDSRPLDRRRVGRGRRDGNDTRHLHRCRSRPRAARS